VVAIDPAERDLWMTVGAARGRHCQHAGMGENSVTVDPGDLRGLAGRIAACADRVGALRCPVLGAGAFDGAAVSRLVGPDAE